MREAAPQTLAARHRARAEALVARRDPRLHAFFAYIFRRAIRADFHALRLDRESVVPEPDAPHLVIYANHPSWWDAALYNVLHPMLFGRRPGFAPLDAAMLEQYRFMGRIGAIGVDQSTRAGAAAFLSTCAYVMEAPERMLWVAAQGEFADARRRPLALRPGLAHLAARAPQAQFVPLAVEYTFWDERTPEALIRFGLPVPASELVSLGKAEGATRLEAALTETLDALAENAISRDPARFRTLLSGRVGVGGVYDLWRRARALASGRRFEAAHNPAAHRPTPGEAEGAP